MQTILQRVNVPLPRANLIRKQELVIAFQMLDWMPIALAAPAPHGIQTPTCVIFVTLHQLDTILRLKNVICVLMRGLVYQLSADLITN
jgi:hypothetical protein